MSEHVDPLICDHPNFAASVNVARISDIGRFVAHVRVTCVACGTPFKFMGLPGGYCATEPMVSALECEACLPIEPMDEAHDLWPDLTVKAQ